MQIGTALLLSFLVTIDHASGRPRGDHARAVPVRRNVSDGVSSEPVAVPPSSAINFTSAVLKRQEPSIFNITKFSTKTVTVSLTTAPSLPTPLNILNTTSSSTEPPAVPIGSLIPAPTPIPPPPAEPETQPKIPARGVNSRRVPQLIGVGAPRLGFLAPSPPVKIDLPSRDAPVRRAQAFGPGWRPWFGSQGPPWGGNGNRPRPNNFPFPANTQPGKNCPFHETETQEEAQSRTNLTRRNAKTRFTINQILNPRFQNTSDNTPNGLKAMMEAYAKYGSAMPPAVRFAAQHNPSLRAVYKRGNNGQAGVVEAIPERNDFEYLSPVQIGTPPQTVNLAIDTGSADLWVLTPFTPPSSLTTHRLYSPLNSSTALLLPNHTWSIRYGDGSTASGTVYRDVVSLGPITSPLQTVQSASRISRAFTYDAACSGILGLGFSHGSSVRPGKALTFMDSVRGELEQEVFTADLKRGRPGRYGFGYVDRGAYYGRMGYASVMPREAIWWRFEVERAGVYGEDADGRGSWDGDASGNGNGTGEEKFAAIADTGTSLLLVPQGLVRRYYGRVGGSGYDADWAGWVFPCDAALPDWSFMLGDGYRGTVPGRYMVYSRVNGTHCFGGMQSSEGIPFAIFGDVLLKAQFVVFDVAEKRVGFASKVLTS